MTERHWCMHVLYVLEAMNKHVHLLGIKHLIHGGNKSNLL